MKENIKEVEIVDAAMWTTLQRQKQSNPMGCGAFIIELFASYMLMPATAVSTPEEDVHTGNSVSALPFFKMCVAFERVCSSITSRSSDGCDADISMAALG